MTKTTAARKKSTNRKPARRQPATRRTPPRHPVIERVAELGVLRLVLVALALICLALMPPAGAAVGYSGWPLVRTVLVPVVAPLVFMVLLLDALMSAVFLADQRGPARRRYARILAVDLVAAGLLLVFWLPFYLALGG
ncbi:MAG TPA: hypothetical protein VGA00_12840 [Acidiferrobacterales bacterium]|jgi:hypothetical protein